MNSFFIHLWTVSPYYHYNLLFLIKEKKNIVRGHESPNLKKWSGGKKELNREPLSLRNTKCWEGILGVLPAL